jgi:hypothetical protein
MTDDDEARAEAAKCLRTAKITRNQDERQSWLALAESWLTTIQLQPAAEQKFQVTEKEKAKALEWAAQ